jgi:hypothetical protein
MVKGTEVPCVDNRRVTEMGGYGLDVLGTGGDDLRVQIELGWSNAKERQERT